MTTSLQIPEPLCVSQTVKEPQALPLLSLSICLFVWVTFK